MSKEELISSVNAAARALFEAIEHLELEYDVDAESLVDMIDNGIEDFLLEVKQAK